MLKEVIDEGRLAELPPTEEARVWLDMIALAFKVFGVDAARSLWARSPLPQAGDDQ